MAYYRADGVRITHDPYARGMAEKYGAPGKTDADGFVDPIEDEGNTDEYEYEDYDDDFDKFLKDQVVIRCPSFWEGCISLF